jgi:hypothetical protein
MVGRRHATCIGATSAASCGIRVEVCGRMRMCGGRRPDVMGHDKFRREEEP